jgi:hypothetical protein
MIYGDYLSTAEMQRWILDLDIPWDDVDPSIALRQPDLLERVRDSALIESFFPIFTCRAMDLLWNDVSATAVFSIQLASPTSTSRVQPVLHASAIGQSEDQEIGDPAAQSGSAV